MSGLMPWYILREFDNSGKLLVGGKIYFYESGTLVPKATYTTYELNVENPNPIILDAGGASEIWLGDGAYRVHITDADDVQIRPYIDGVMGAGSGLGVDSNATLAAVKVYNDLRALTDTPDLVYCSGAYLEGDGGQGWFQLLPNSTLADDDGIVLTSLAGTNVYKRIFDGYIDPQWYSLKYSTSTDQTSALNKVIAASVEYNFPALIAGPTYLTQIVNITAGSTINCTVDGFFHSGSALTMTFAEGSHFDGEGISFGANLTPVFGNDVVPVAKLSWMGGQTNEEKISKLAACAASGVDQVVLLDVSYTVSSFPSFASNYHVDVAGGMLTTTGTANLSMDVIYTGDSQFINYSSTMANVGTVWVGQRPARPEWFGAKGDNTTDDAVAFQACFKHGDILLMNKSYRLARKIDATHITVRSDLVASIAVNAPITGVSNVPTPRLYMDPATALEVVNFTTAGQFSANGVGLALTANAVIQTLSGNIHLDNCVVWGPDNSLKSTYLAANDTVIGSSAIPTASIANQCLVNVRYDNNYSKRYYRNNSSFQDVYLENEVNSTSHDNILTTDSTGKIVGKDALQFQTLDVNERLTTRYLLEEGIEVTNIRFHWYVDGGTPHCDLYRNEVFVQMFANDPAYYTVRAYDNPVIIVRSENYNPGWPSMSILPSASKPSNSVRNTIINTTPYGLIYIGEVTPLHMHNTARLLLPSQFTGSIVGTGIWTGTKWAFEA